MTHADRDRLLREAATVVLRLAAADPAGRAALEQAASLLEQAVEDEDDAAVRELLRGEAADIRAALAGTTEEGA